MAFDISTNVYNNYISVEAAGNVTESNLLDLGHKIKKICAANNVNSVLLDCKRMEGAISLGSLFFTVQKFIEIIGKKIKVAYINPPESWKPEDDELSRRTATAEGGNLEVFESETDAVAWLSVVDLHSGS